MQLALALLIRDLLPGLKQPPLLFDPAFSDVDVLLLQHLGLERITVNEQGRRPAHVPTLFYMPHCEVRLGEGLGCSKVCGAPAMVQETSISIDGVDHWRPKHHESPRGWKLKPGHYCLAGSRDLPCISGASLSARNAYRKRVD